MSDAESNKPLDFLGGMRRPQFDQDDIDPAPPLRAVDPAPEKPSTPTPTPEPTGARKAKAPAKKKAASKKASSARKSPARDDAPPVVPPADPGGDYAFMPVGEYQQDPTEPRAKDSGMLPPSLLREIEMVRMKWTVHNQAWVDEHGSMPHVSGFKEALMRMGLKHINDPELSTLIPPDRRRGTARRTVDTPEEESDE